MVKLRNKKENGAITMGQNQEKKRYRELVALVNQYNQQYHEENASDISDYEFDMLNQELKELEKKYPEWITEESPSKKVGGKVKREAGVEVTHHVPMLSIQDVFTKEEVVSWIEEVQALHEDAIFSVEHKIDGLSMSLRYQNGELFLAETRGNGMVGEDVTLNSREIPDIKEKLEIPYEYLEIRGEVYMTHEDFERTNEKQELANKKVFANPRNCAAGTLRQLDPSITKERGLRFFTFNIQDGPKELMQCHTKGLDYLEQKGVTVVPHILCKTAQEVLCALDKIGEERENYKYDIDGAVIKIEQIEYRDDFQAGSKYTSGHIAYKYPPEEKETEVLDIELSVGRTGKIAPTAVLNPIRLCGTTVSRATLHNQEFINSLGIGLHAKVCVVKSGEIIPKIVRVTQTAPEVYQIPNFCPVCKEPVEKEKDTADIFCVNPACPAQLLRTISYFVGKDAMDIKNFGEKYVQGLIDEGYVHNFADLYRLKNFRDELVEKGIMGKEKNTDKILTAIEESKKNDPVKLLIGFGIGNVGKASAKEIMSHFDSIEDLAKASIEELVAIQDVGAITAESIRAFFDHEHNMELLEELKEQGVRTVMKKNQKETEKLSGLTFCVTGTLPTMKRSEIESLVEQNGGKLIGVGKKLNYLIAGENAGSKLEKANALGISILSEADFLKMLE